MVIRTPPAWGWDKISSAMQAPTPVSAEQYWAGSRPVQTVPAVRRIGIVDLKRALVLGLQDFAAFRSDVVPPVIDLVVNI